MSGLFGSGSTINQTETPLTGLQIQSSSYGLPMAFGYGRTKVTPNLIWYGDFTAVPHTSSQSSGGKGGGGVTSTSTTYTYTASLALALGETVSAINQVWINKAAAENANIKFTLFNGPDPQTAWSYLTGAHPTEALGYSGMAYVAAAGYDLGTNTNLPNHTFDATLKLPLGGGVDDADPGQFLPDLLTNSQYGVPNFPLAILSDLTNYSAYCRSAGLLLSPLYDTPTAASDIVTRLMQFTNSGVFFSEGLLKVTPYGDTAISGHGATYTPNMNPVADFGEDDFLVSGSEDPVRVKRNAIPETVSGSADVYNQVTLEILDRSQDYRAVPVIAQDMVSIDAIGLRPMSAITAHEIADPAVGQSVANLILQRALNIRATYEWSAGWQWCRIEPTDIVSLTDLGLGMDGYPVRILTIEEDGETGGLKFTAEDVPFGIGHHVASPLPGLGGYAVNQAIPPGPTNAPVIFEPPNSLTAPDLQLWIAASGGVNWGGCEVWASSDGTSYRRIGLITNPARHGTLTAQLVAGADPDTTHSLAVELGACRGQLLPGTTADADAGNTLLWVDGELIAYSAATLTGSYAYTLGGYLRRGMKGTANATHASGSQFARIDEALFRYTVSTDRIGAPVWLKFPAFNTQGFALQSLADVTAYQHTLAGNRPLPLTSLNATGGMFQIILSWGFQPGQIDRDYTEIWGGTSNDRSAALPITSAKNPTAAWKHSGLQPGQTWYYWGRVVDTSGNTSDFYPPSPTGGVASAPSADPSSLLTQLQNSVGLGQLTAELSSPITLIPEIISTLDWNQQTDDIATAAGVALFSGSVVSAGAKVATEQITRETADSALASTITTVSAATQAAAAAIQTEETARANADSALASRATSLESSVNSATTGLNTKASVGYVDAAKADAISASATAVAVVQARLDTGDYAAVKDQSSASVSRLGVIEAKHSVKVDVNGHVAGTELISDGTVGSFIILADQFLVVKPDGTGTPKQVLTLGTVNGVSALGLDGNLIVDGSIVARTLAAGTITADKINGTNLDVVNGTFSGSLSAATGVFSGALNGATGTFSGKLSAGILDPAAFSGREYAYGTPGTYTFTIPSDTGWPSITLRVTLQGAGGGGGGGNSGNDGYSCGSGGGGGGAGTQVVYTVGGVSPGQQFSIVVGSGGAGGANHTLSGVAGGATVLSGYASASGGQGGAHGNRDTPYTAAGGSLGGGTGTLNTDTGLGSGGTGGGSAYSGGGQAGTYYSNGGTGGPGAGGGGGGSSGWNPNDVETAGGAGGAGYASVEIYDPNGVVLNGRYSSLVTWLDGIGHGAVPTNAR